MRGEDMTPYEVEQEIKWVEENGTKAKGKADYIAHLKGKRLTMKRAILASCYVCSLLDGCADCGVKNCPLYPFMPYGTAPVAKSNRGRRKKVAEEGQE